MDPISIGLLIVVAVFVGLSWPFRRERSFRLELSIAAARERVWSAYHTDLDDPVSAAFHGSTVSFEQISDEPAIEEFVFDTSGGHGTHFTKARYQRLELQRPAFSVSRNCAINGNPYPYGRAQRETLRLAEQPGGTHLTFEFQGETGTLWQFLALRRGVRRYFERVKQFCETGSAARRPARRRGLVISLVLSVLAVASFSVWLGWIGALALTAVLVLHEFGHWLAMRMTGQPAPRMLLIPFFGGMAVANHPHRTLFHDAFCSLMGPGFSAFLALGLLVVAWRLGMPPALFGEDAAAALQVEVPLARKAIVIAFVIGLLNALQLLPVLPLDGGHTLRALAQSFNPR